MPKKGLLDQIDSVECDGVVDVSTITYVHSEKGSVTLTKTDLIQLNRAFPESRTNIYLH